MTLDNVLKATIDAIGESDNEIAGQLITRTRDRAHPHGQDNALVSAAAPTRLTSLVDIFDSDMVGMGLDVIVPADGTPTGNEGSYLVDTFIDAKNVTLTKIDGTAAAFVNQDPVRWRLTTLKVETTFGFPDRDRDHGLWVGIEPLRIPYAELVGTPGAQEFRGLGPQRFSAQGTLTAATNTVATPGAFFEAADVGRALWVYPVSTPNGNEGPRLITAVAGDLMSCTVSGAAFGTTETGDARFVVKDYSTPDGHLSGRVPGRPKVRQVIRELSEVVDGSQSFSALDKLRRALLTEFATEEELDRIGRNLGTTRLPGMGDEVYRCVLQTQPYLPKATVYGLELLLECLFPGGGFTIYEDLENFPNTVFILIDAITGTTTILEGKTFLAPTGKDVTPPTDPALGGDAVGTFGRELQTSTTALTLPIAHTPISIVDILQVPQPSVFDDTLLPSAQTPAWTYVDESDAGTVETDVFTANVQAFGGAATDRVLSQIPKTAASDDSGRAEKTITTESIDGSRVEVETWFAASFNPAEVNGFPWGLRFQNVGREFGVFWNLNTARLTDDPVNAGVVPDVEHDLNLGDNNGWNRIKLVRETVGEEHFVSVFFNGRPLFSGVNVTDFPVSGSDTVSFGYWFQSGATQDWTAYWKDLTVTAFTPRNHANITRQDGVFSGADDDLTSAAALFTSADTGKRVRIKGTGGTVAARRNKGLWEATFVNATTLSLAGITSDSIVTVQTVGGQHFVDILDPRFVADDVNKEIEILGSALGNNGTRIVQEVVSPFRVRVDGSDFVNEQSIQYRFNPYNGTSGQFEAASGFEWELIDTAVEAAGVVTIRDALPGATTDVEQWYTSVLSAQILRNEFVENKGSSASAPDVYYPFYLFDVDQTTRKLMDEVTAAGVIPEFERKF